MDHKFFIHKQIKRKYMLLNYVYFFQKNYFFEYIFFSKYLNLLNLNENFKLNYFSYINFDSKFSMSYDNFLKKKSFELFKDTYYARYNK
jgi:hypothetical protein